MDFLSIFTAAFLAGFAGSIHCIGMCGPIVGSISIGNPKNLFIGITIYHISRIASYAMIGVVFGMIGYAIKDTAPLLALQKYILVAAGIIMIFFALYLGGFLPEKYRLLSFVTIPAKYMKKAVDGESLTAWAGIGLVNGFIPCGLVYVALALAVASGSAINGLITMILFGIGTVPALLTLTFFANRLRPARRPVLVKIASLSIAFFGLFMIAKGLYLVADKPIKMGIMQQERLNNKTDGETEIVIDHSHKGHI